MNTLPLAVVGHTNTGKTSLLRTLLRDEQFGEVKNSAATTRDVTEAPIHDGSRTLVKLYDTPGLEDAAGVLDWLERETSSRLDGIERIEAFLRSEAAATDFNQEAKVLRQMLASDTGLYVIDAREPVLARYKDELTVLSWCARPLMPVFNFTHGADTAAWQEMLARRGLHVYSSFDTVAFDFEGEMRLWNNLATMLPPPNPLTELAALRRRDWQQLDQDARRAVAAFLLEAAAYKQEIDAGDDPQPVQQQMQAVLRQRERQMQRELLHIYRFYREDPVAADDWVLQPLRQDPFDAALWKHYGIRTTSGAATGALFGLGIDALTLGASGGLGTAVGGILGGLLPNMQTISDKISGRQTLYTDEATLNLLAARALDLLARLQARGHAAQNDIRLEHGRAPWPDNRLPSVLADARHRPEYSSLNGSGVEKAEYSRREAAEKLAARLTAVQAPYT